MAWAAATEGLTREARDKLARSYESDDDERATEISDAEAAQSNQAAFAGLMGMQAKGLR